MFILELVLSMLTPFECLSCGREGGLVCSWCEPDFCSPLPSRCFMCRRISQQSAVCQKCRPKTPLRHVWVAAELSGNAQKLLHLFKFERAQSASREIGRFIYYALPFSDEVLLVPVPPATTRLRQRGYDHTKLLAREVSKATGLPYKQALSKLGQSRQVGMKREVRLKQLNGAFRVSRTDDVKDKAIWLVDDVVTTGATLSEAARALRRSGAKSVDAVVFAQK